VLLNTQIWRMWILRQTGPSLLLAKEEASFYDFSLAVYSKVHLVSSLFLCASWVYSLLHIVVMQWLKIRSLPFRKNIQN
jgi:hypothetical protein